jgi:helicase required for RNAi-mediated heterochromatin assembly 1
MLVENVTACAKLKYQHRLLPTFSKLISHFYKDLKLENLNNCKDDDSVKGFNKNVLFISHNELESVDEKNGTSKWNSHEVLYAANLYKHILRQGLSQTDITILSMYGEQVKRIRKQLKEMGLNKVQVYTVDSFQGQENKLIILSLVRANHTNNVGFTDSPNRMCVALSRAKNGFFCISNFKVTLTLEFLS